MDNLKILLLGGSNTGKTHFAGQLYGRLQRTPGKLKLREECGTPDDLSALEEVLDSLENGHAARHTPISQWSEITLPLVDDQGNSYDLNWPDYGGEQVDQILKDRAVPLDWANRLKTAEGWLLLIRIGTATLHQGELNSKTTNGKSSHETRSENWDTNAEIVELLQILLHTSNTRTQSGIQSPRLAVLLSCIDEVPNDDCTPTKILKEKMPLVASFIAANWASDAFSIWGLSSLGCLLEEDSEEDKFIDNGPETQGWVIPPESIQENSDLTLPIGWLLRSND